MTIEYMLYTDGSCRNNGKQGQTSMGIGYKLVNCHNGHIDEDGLHKGEGTSNLAELLAIEEGLNKIIKELRNDAIVTVKSDSAWAIGILSMDWKATVHLEIIARIKRLIREFRTVEFEWVRGHQKHAGNLRADELAREASYKGKYSNNYRSFRERK